MTRINSGLPNLFCVMAHTEGNSIWMAHGGKQMGWPPAMSSVIQSAHQLGKDMVIRSLKSYHEQTSWNILLFRCHVEPVKEELEAEHTTLYVLFAFPRQLFSTQVVNQKSPESLYGCDCFWSLDLTGNLQWLWKWEGEFSNRAVLFHSLFSMLQWLIQQPLIFKVRANVPMS